MNRRGFLGLVATLAVAPMVDAKPSRRRFGPRYAPVPVWPPKPITISLYTQEKWGNLLPGDYVKLRQNTGDRLCRVQSVSVSSDGYQELVLY